MSTEPKKSTSHPSDDNRFKLLDRAITKHQSSGDALIEILHVAHLRVDSLARAYGSHILTPQALLDASYQLYGCHPERADHVEIPASSLNRF